MRMILTHSQSLTKLRVITQSYSNMRVRVIINSRRAHAAENLFFITTNNHLFNYVETVHALHFMEGFYAYVYTVEPL